MEDEENLVGDVTNKNSYTNVLPSLAFKYNGKKDWVYRAAFSTSFKNNFPNPLPCVSGKT